jgi:sugar phosphate isomerase/epimerase
MAENLVQHNSLGRPNAPAKRVGGAILKTGLNAYSFNQALQKDLTLLDLLDYCAEQGFDALDPTGYFFPGYPNVPDETFINAFKRRAFLLGVAISGTGIRNDFTSPDKEKRAADITHIKEWIEVCARLGAPFLPAKKPRDTPGTKWPIGWWQT